MHRRHSDFAASRARCAARAGAARAGAFWAVMTVAVMALGACGSTSQLPRLATTVPGSTTASASTPTTGAVLPTTTSDPTTTAPDTTTSTPSSTTTTEPPTTTTAPTTTTTSVRTTTSVPAAITTTVPATTTVPPATTTNSAPWAWLVLALALLAGVVAVIVLAVRRRNRNKAEQAWRHGTGGPLDEARLARELLPASGSDIPDAAHWQSVRERVEQAALTLEQAGAGAPSVAGATASRSAAEALRGLVFALEADRLLRDGTQAPSPDQLAQADATCRARTADLDGALDRLDRLVHPRPEGGAPPPNGVSRSPG